MLFIRSHSIISKSNIETDRILEVYSSEAEVLKQDSHMNDFIMHMIRMLLALQSRFSEFFLMEIRFQ